MALAGLLIAAACAGMFIPSREALAQDQEQPQSPPPQEQPQQPPAALPRERTQAPPRRVRVVPEGGAAATTGAADERGDVQAEPQRIIPLYPGEARLIDAPWPVVRVSVANPEIADVDVVNPQQVQLIGISPGVTNLILWSKEERTWRARVEVEPDLSKLEGQLQKVLPRSELEVTQVGDVIVVKGTLPRAEQAIQLRQFLETSKLNHLDLTRVAGSQQVQLKVRIAEVSRNALKQLNVNAFYAGDRWFGGIQLGSSASTFTQIDGVFPGDPVPVPPTAQIFAGFPNSDLLVFLQALAENQYLRLLAEPTLVAYSGEEARFLVGGEVPIPISEQGEGNTTISIEYREYGVRLKFIPTVLGDGGIRLVVEPEVSELTDVGSIEVQGSRIPAMLTRRVMTTLELQTGQTFAMAGLLNSATNARRSRVPGIGDLPIIGALFRSVRYSTAETELVILVTASLVEPQSEPFDAIAYPGMTFVQPNDWEIYIENSIAGKQPRRVAPVQAQRLKELGLDKLNGPGAWASYEGRTEAPKASQSGSGTTKTGL